MYKRLKKIVTPSSSDSSRKELERKNESKEEKEARQKRDRESKALKRSTQSQDEKEARQERERKAKALLRETKEYQDKKDERNRKDRERKASKREQMINEHKEQLADLVRIIELEESKNGYGIAFSDGGRVTNIKPKSPAAKAEMKKGQYIIAFKKVNKAGDEKLIHVAEFKTKELQEMIKSHVGTLTLHVSDFSLKEPVQSTSKEMPGYLMDTINEDELNELRVFHDFDFETDSSEDEAQFHGFQTVPSSDEEAHFHGFQTLPSSDEDDISNVGKEATSKPKRNRRRILSSESDEIPDIQTPPQPKKDRTRIRSSSSESDGIPDIQTPLQEHVSLHA